MARRPPVLIIARAVVFVVLLAGLQACKSNRPSGAGGADAGGALGTGGTTGFAGGAGTAGIGGFAGGAGTAGGGGGGTGTAGVGGVAGGDGTAGTTGLAGASGRVPLRHRPVAIACSTERQPNDCATATPPGGGTPYTCRGDADCIVRANGRCEKVEPPDGCACSYDDCLADSDCPTAGICECYPATLDNSRVGRGNTCMAGNCRVDADCGPGGYCSPSFVPCFSYYRCHTPDDTCLDDADCQTRGEHCVFITTKWECSSVSCPG